MKKNKYKIYKRLSRELVPLRSTSIIKPKKHKLINDAIELAIKEEFEDWKNESKQ